MRIYPHLRKPDYAARWLLATLSMLLIASCSSPQAPISIVVGSVATATGLPTVTEVPSAEVEAATPATATTRAPTPTISGLRTKTPVPGSPSPTPTATRRRGGGAASTETPTAGAVGANGGSLDTRSHGVTGTFRLEAAQRVYQPNEQIWFRWTVTNLTEAALNYGYIGVVQSTGGFHTSWSGSFLRPRSTSNWRDWVSFSMPGEYTVFLSMCLSPAAECEGGGKWVDLTAPLSVTIQ
jgi:hypothetical protein